MASAPLAMVLFEQGNTEQALEQLTEASYILDEWTARLTEESGQAQVPWFDVLELRLLHDEAYRRIKGQEPPFDDRFLQQESRALELLQRSRN